MAPTGGRAANKGMDMLNGPLLGKILAFALPLALSSVLQQLFNSADAAFVGHYVDANALAAVGATAPVIGLFINLFVGLSIGANVDLAIHIGHDDPDKVHESVQTAIPLALISGVTMLALGVAFARPIMGAISTPPEVLDDAVMYLDLYFLGMPGAMLFNFGSAVLRSKGDTVRPLVALAVACAANFAGDYVLVELGWGVAGVAIATAAANWVCAAIVVAFLLRERDVFKLVPNQMRIHRAPLVSIVKIGLPAGVQSAVFSLSNVVIQSAINSFGPDAIAGSAAALNAEYYTFFLITAFTNAAVTFTGQNYAARRYDRCRRVYALCMALSVGTSLVSIAVFVGMGEAFLGIFTTDAAAIGWGMTRLWEVELLEFLPSSYEVTAGALRGMGWSTLPAIITIIGSCVLRVVWVWAFFPQINTFEALMRLYPVTWVVTGTAMVGAYIWLRRTAFAAERAE